MLRTVQTSDNDVALKYFLCISTDHDLRADQLLSCSDVKDMLCYLPINHLIESLKKSFASLYQHSKLLQDVTPQVAFAKWQKEGLEGYCE